MALTVENGTGLSAADAYVSLADFKAYCDGRGMDYSASSDATLEQKIRLATEYLDTIFRYKGVRLQSSQALEFPRSGLTDWSGYEVSGVPARVVKATCELAFKGISEALYTDLERGGRVKSESVGPISVTYADDAPAGKVFQAAQKLLAPYIRKETDIDLPPLFSPSEGNPSFSVGMMDHDGASAAEE